MVQLHVELYFGQDDKPPRARCTVPAELSDDQRRIIVRRPAGRVEQLDKTGKPVWHHSNQTHPREFLVADGKRVPGTQFEKARKSHQNWYLSPTTIQMLRAKERNLIDEHGRVFPHLFGKDHWSLLGYVGCRIASHPAGNAIGVGEMDKRNLRCNPARHPVHAIVLDFRPGEGLQWKEDYGTRLAGFWAPDGICPDLRLPYHDDWDCLNDFEAAGFLTVWSEINAFVELTDIGARAYGQLMEHKARGGNFATFKLEGQVQA